MPGLIRAARLASQEADGIGPAADARKRLMIVPNCHVQELITETQPDNWVRVTGVRVWQNGGSVDVMLAPPRNGGQSAVVLALGTVETTRVARTTFQQSLAGRAAERMGKNLMAHLRSNLTIRIPRAAIAANLPPTVIPSLQVSALLVKGKAANGQHLPFPDHRLRPEQARRRLRGRAVQEDPDPGAHRRHAAGRPTTPS